jgi:hypothetical protein
MGKPTCTACMASYGLSWRLRLREVRPRPISKSWGQTAADMKDCAGNHSDEQKPAMLMLHSDEMGVAGQDGRAAGWQGSRMAEDNGWDAGTPVPPRHLLSRFNRGSNCQTSLPMTTHFHRPIDLTSGYTILAYIISRGVSFHTPDTEWRERAVIRT